MMLPFLTIVALTTLCSLLYMIERAVNNPLASCRRIGDHFSQSCLAYSCLREIQQNPGLTKIASADTDFVISSIRYSAATTLAAII